MYKKGTLIYPELSYKINGILFTTHNELGPYEREKKFGDRIEELLQQYNLAYKRELMIGSSGNILDFLIDNKIVLELKAKRVLVKDDYDQVQRYLQATNMKLGILVNFRCQYIKPRRVVKIETHNKTKFQ